MRPGAGEFSDRAVLAGSLHRVARSSEVMLGTQLPRCPASYVGHTLGKAGPESFADIVDRALPLRSLIIETVAEAP